MEETPEHQMRLPPVIRALRPYQWAKNLLLAVPLAMSHQIRDMHKLTAVAVAVAAFCLAASAGYIINDIHDRAHDRQHARKRTRPFASGQLSVATGVGMIGVLLLGAFAIGWALGRTFSALLALYLVMTLLYSLDLKRRLIIDVITLAGLYTLRLIAGGVAASVEVSHWLLALSMFLFLSLAFAKRYAELAGREPEQEQLNGRNYSTSDLGIIESIGPTSGYMAVLVLALYINSGVSRNLYRHPDLLWLVCPVALYWITRVWFLARRRAMLEDPLLFAMTDRISWVAGLSTLLIAWMAS